MFPTTSTDRRESGFRVQDIPDDFTVLTGNMELEHIPTLHTLYKLKRDLQSERQETSTHIHTNTF